MSTARVDLWGKRIGAVHWDREREIGLFEYDAEFLHSGIQLSPLHMPLGSRVYSFPALGRDSFQRLPGMLADVLPDRFGNALIDAWLAARGRSAESFNPVERLCYTGSRGMGALEFVPALAEFDKHSSPIDVAALVDLASRVLQDRRSFATSLADGDESHAVSDILRVGTSAGGARAKAVIAWNPETGEVHSGDARAAEGFSHWLLKFDGVVGNRDRELTDPAGYGRIEYAYHKLAVAAGIEMRECQLLHENGRSHFLTRRFDRTDEGGKLHLQSLGALAHFDFGLAGAYSYEQAMQVMRQLELPMNAIEEQFRRMIFNVLARNQDDHVKNIAFLMNKAGEWSLAPAFDVTFSFNPEGAWTARHQMTVNGKRDDFELADFEACEQSVALKRGRARALVDEVREALRTWPQVAAEVGIAESWMERIAGTHRLEFGA